MRREERKTQISRIGTNFSKGAGGEHLNFLREQRSGGVAQVSQPAVSPISNRLTAEKLPTVWNVSSSAGWKHCDTAGWETRATQELRCSPAGRKILVAVWRLKIAGFGPQKLYERPAGSNRSDFGVVVGRIIFGVWQARCQTPASYDDSVSIR
jgi:hypothetical protein